MKLLKTIKDKLFGSDWGPDSVKIPKSWKEAGGEGVTVLLIDSGVMPPRGYGWVFDYYDYDASKSFVYGEDKWDDNGHGTAVAGVIHDWAPKATVISYKAMDRDGHLEDCTNILAALRAAVTLRPDVVNLSVAAYRGVSKLHAPIDELIRNGTAVVAGAGNKPESGVAYPARFDGVFAPGACDRRGRRAKFSPPEARFLMPGVDIRVRRPDGSYQISSGTSLASAAASGLLALAMSAGLGAAEAQDAVLGLKRRAAR